MYKRQESTHGFCEYEKNIVQEITNVTKTFLILYLILSQIFGEVFKKLLESLEYRDARGSIASKRNLVKTLPDILVIVRSVILFRSTI